MSAAIERVNASRSSWATTWLTRPKWRASSADRKLPVKLISRARRTPIACGSSTVRPQPGMTPTRVWVSPNRARSEATRKSQLRASSKPPVMAKPLTAPMTGLATSGYGPRVTSPPPPAPRLLALEPSSLRSRPAQKAGSAPVRIITSTSSRPSASTMSCGSRRRTSLDRALRASGRFSVMVAMRSRTSSKTGSVMRRTVSPAPGGAGLRLLVGRQVAEGQVTQAHEHGRDPAAEGAEVLVEQAARPVGEGLLGQLVQAFVGDLDGELGRPRHVVVVGHLHRGGGPLQRLVADDGTRRRQHGEEA